MRQIYNKSALEKLQSLDQLDRMIVITSRKLWIFLIAALVVIAVVLLWAIKGQIPVNLESSGIYMNTEGTEVLYSQNSGFITEILTGVGQRVKKGDVLAYIKTTEETEKAQKIDERKRAVQNVTFESIGDLASADNAQLLELKRSAITLGSNVETSRASLELKTKMRNKAEDETEEKKRIMEGLRQAYYSSIQVSSQTPYVEYNMAQSEYSMASSTALTLKNIYLQASNSAESVRKSFNATYNTEYPANPAGKSDDPNDPAYDVNYAVAKTNVASSLSAVSAYQEEYRRAQDEADVAEYQAYNTKNMYEAYQNAEGNKTDFNTVSGAEYNKALSDYTTAEAAYKSLKSEVDVLALQLQLNENNLETQIAALRIQFDNTKGALLDQLDTEKQKYIDVIEKASVKATADGEIYELAMDEGGAVQQGSRVGSIIVGDPDTNMVVCYVPIKDAKKIEPGMNARAYPTTVNKQEYGHISAKVTDVSAYPASSTDMLTVMGSESLVAEFQKMGPVIAVSCELDKDENSASGYLWSTKKGAEVTLLPCTLMNVSIQVEMKAPIDIIIPYIKEKLSFSQAFSR